MQRRMTTYHNVHILALEASSGDSKLRWEDLWTRSICQPTSAGRCLLFFFAPSWK